MKARKVKKLDPDAPFERGVRQTLEVRLAELRGLAKTATADPQEVEALHDMRIAAKRVRYVLELASPVLGPKAGRGMKAAKELQDLLGEIHDCDDLLPLVERHMERLRDEDAAAASAGEALPNRRKYRGLEALRAHTVARRGQLYGEFLKQWPRLGRALDPTEAVTA